MNEVFNDKKYCHVYKIGRLCSNTVFCILYVRHKVLDVCVGELPAGHSQDQNSSLASSQPSRSNWRLIFANWRLISSIGSKQVPAKKGRRVLSQRRLGRRNTGRLQTKIVRMRMSSASYSTRKTKISAMRHTRRWPWRKLWWRMLIMMTRTMRPSTELARRLIFSR